MTDYSRFKNESLIKIYTNALSNVFNNKIHNFWKGNMVLCRVIHREQDFCFNCEYREILYSIRDCFFNANICFPEFRENLWGKCLTLSIHKTPMIPPFENILYYYQENFFKRLQVIDMYFSRQYTPPYLKDKLVELITEKKALVKTNFPYNTFYINGLPLDILNYIFDYLKYIDVYKSFILRKKYENLTHQS